MRFMALWRKIPTVTAKFLVIIIPILAIGTLFFSIIFFFTKLADLKQGLAKRIDTVAEINAVALAASMWAFDTESTNHIIEAIAVNSEIRCIEVSDDLAHLKYFWPHDGCSHDLIYDSVSKRAINVQHRRLGSLSLYYKYDAIIAQVRAELLNNFWLLLLLVSGTMLSALLAHRITIGVPLRRLLESIRSAEEEGERRLAVWTSADELGRVIAAYNRLLERLTSDERALRRSEQRLSLAFAATRSSLWDWDLRTGVYWCSEALPAMLGYPPNTLTVTLETWESLVHPDELPDVWTALAHYRAGKRPSFELTYRMRRGDGSWAWIEDKATAFRDDTRGIVLRLTGTMTDVTDRVIARETLAQERRILQATLENLDQGILMVDGERRLMVYNRRLGELFDLPESFLASRPSYDDIIRYQVEQGEFADYGEDPYPHIRQWIDRPEVAFTDKRRRPDGSVLQVHVSPLAEGGFVSTVSDITVETRSTEDMFMAMQATEHAYAELKQTQASLVQAEKMASLATLVAGIAHEINTPVGIAYGCATHLDARTRSLREALDSGALRKSDLTGYMTHAAESSRLMLSNLTRAAELIQSFKQVAVDQTSAERRRFDLKPYLDEIVTSLGPQLRGTGHVVRVSGPRGVEMNGYPGALSQVVTNLIMNSLVHAYEKGQTGRLILSFAPLGEEDVELRFSDDGKGIPAENLDHIFEPFFTTRRGSGGSGLGLHIVYNIITQSLGGRITVESEVGTGTTFTMRFPRHTPAKA